MNWKDDLMINTLYSFAGTLGSVLRLLRKKVSFIEGVFQVLSGFACANWFSPVVLHALGLNPLYHGGVSFLIGYLSSELLLSFFPSVIKKLKKMVLKKIDRL